MTNASGVFSSTVDSLEGWLDAGLKALIVKTATYKPRKGYDYPNAAVFNEGVVQAMGLPNPGYKKVALFVKEIKIKHPDIFVIASFAASDKKELQKMITFLGKYADALEFNISCPHAEGLGSSVGYDFKLLGELCKAGKEYCEKPFGLKMPYYPTDKMLKSCIRASESADFYTIINSVGKAMVLGKKFGLSNRLGGLSGSAIKPLAIGQVYRTRGFTNKFIFGCGGIVDRNDVAEFLKAGANAIQLGSGINRYPTKKDFVNETKAGFNHILDDYFEKQGKEVWE
ncbi:MAG: dihydroorotate dehydrogenase [archaeon]|nr:MAG: dihydroorotate dehydrogenase [archaeon]